MIKKLMELIARRQGVLKLAPTFVHRFYSDGNRLGQTRLKARASEQIPERWIASSVAATNPRPLPPGGLSMLADLPGVSLRDAIRAAPHALLGEALFAQHGPEFRVLVKLLDPGEAIPLHFHATDEQVRRFPRRFRGHRFGKDEAYYFPQVSPKGPLPYTHVGLYPGVTRRELIAAVRKGRDYALELSPVVYQQYETGFFLPASVPHSPGTALTLEIQQPSDVYTLLESDCDADAFDLIDMQRSAQVGRLNRHVLRPRVTFAGRAGEIAEIFPLKVCGKFGGNRVRVVTRLCVRESTPMGLLVWQGRGTLDGRPIRAGDEFFISAEAARRGIELASSGAGKLDAFTFFPGEG